jgi:hypothetical protein
MVTLPRLSRISTACLLVGFALAMVGCRQDPDATPPADTAEGDQETTGTNAPTDKDAAPSDEPTLADALNAFRSGAEEAAVKSLRALGFYDPDRDGELDLLQITEEEFKRLSSAAQRETREAAVTLATHTHDVAGNLMAKAEAIKDESPEKAREYLEAARTMGQYLQRETLELLQQTGKAIVQRTEQKLAHLKGTDPTDTANGEQTETPLSDEAPAETASDASTPQTE